MIGVALLLHFGAIIPEATDLGRRAGRASGGEHNVRNEGGVWEIFQGNPSRSCHWDSQRFS